MLQKDVALKVPLRLCTTKINNMMIDDSEYLDIVISMFNLLWYRSNYSITSGSLWNYYRDKIHSVNYDTSEGKSFTYKTKIIRKTEGKPPGPPVTPAGEVQPSQPPVPSLNTEVTILQKYLSNFWRLLHLPSINCEVELDLLLTGKCLLSEDDDKLSNATFQTKSTKLYTLSSTFSFKDDDNGPRTNSFEKYFISLKEMKDFNVLINNKLFLDQPVKNKQEACKKYVEMPRNDDYTTGNLLDYSNHQNYHKVIGNL